MKYFSKLSSTCKRSNRACLQNDRLRPALRDFVGQDSLLEPFLAPFDCALPAKRSPLYVDVVSRRGWDSSEGVPSGEPTINDLTLFNDLVRPQPIVSVDRLEKSFARESFFPRLTAFEVLQGIRQMTLCVADLAGIVNRQPSVQLFSGTVVIRSVFLATKYVCIKQMDNLGKFSGAFPKTLLRRGWDSSEGVPSGEPTVNDLVYPLILYGPDNAGHCWT